MPIMASRLAPGGTPKVRAIASIGLICGLAACPFRSFQIAVSETRSPRSPLDQARHLGVAPGAAAGRRVLSMSQFTLSAWERGSGSASVLPVVCSGIAAPASTVCAGGQARGSAEAADRPRGRPHKIPTTPRPRRRSPQKT
jgi:hypothetical protein